MFFCEYCTIFSNTCFEEHLHVPISENYNNIFLGKATSHNDHYIIHNMDGQRQGPQIGSN